MAILVTGGAGYIGSVTVEHVRAAGEEVVVLDNLSRGHREAVGRDVAFYEGEVGDPALLQRIAGEHRLESCIHFAALAYVEESVRDPRSYFQNNVEQGAALIHALLDAGVRRFVFSSSCATYGQPESLPIREDARQCPASPYGWTKLMLERLLASYDAAYGLKYVALRYFNAAGATEEHGEDHEPETHLVANVLRAAAGEIDAVPVFGGAYATADGTAVRDFVHVADLADAHLRAVRYLRNGGTSDCLNLGAGRGYSVMEVVKCARKITGREIAIRVEGAREGDPTELIADAGKAQRVLGWTAKQSDLETIVRTAWEWRKKNPRGCAAPE